MDATMFNMVDVARGRARACLLSGYHAPRDAAAAAMLLH